MSFDWIKYIDLSKYLFSLNLNSLEEACFRSSISRAYYGVFCLSRDKAGLTNYRPAQKTDLGEHKKVIETYKTSDDSSLKKIGITLDGLRKKRNNADYEGDKAIGKNDAEQAILMADEILQNFSGPIVNNSDQTISNSNNIEHS